jgi:hypothetical protein
MVKKCESRQESIRLNRLRYDGGPCKKCNETLRWVSDHSCVKCKSEQSSKVNATFNKKLKDEGRYSEYHEQYGPRHRERAKERYGEKKHEDRKTRLGRFAELGIHYKQNLLRTVSSRARKKNLPYNLTVEDINIPKFCPVFGIELKFNKNGMKNDSPSLDRIIPGNGYVANNVIVISMKANRIKADATLEELKCLFAFYDKLINE